MVGVPGRAAIVGAVGVLLLALAAVALGFTASESRRAVVPVALSAGGQMRLVSSRGSRAIFVARNVAPGATVGGTTTVRSLGADGRLILTARNLADQPGPGGGSVASAARLKIVDLSRRPRRVVYSGSLARMPRLHLGLLPAHAKRSYRFLAKLPDAGLDNSLSGSELKLDYRWQLLPGGRARSGR
jgi:hypothetical protein